MTCKVDSIICMMWKNKEGDSFKVGEVSKKAGKHYFRYDINGVETAKEYGFCPLPQFPIVDAKYFREELFNTFSKSLPGHGKKDKTSILKEYDLKEYDEFELLKKVVAICKVIILNLFHLLMRGKMSWMRKLIC